MISSALFFCDLAKSCQLLQELFRFLTHVLVTLNLLLCLILLFVIRVSCIDGDILSIQVVLEHLQFVVVGGEVLDRRGLRGLEFRLEIGLELGLGSRLLSTQSTGFIFLGFNSSLSEVLDSSHGSDEAGKVGLS